jgi:hypothetical protein
MVRGLLLLHCGWEAISSEATEIPHG